MSYIKYLFSLVLAVILAISAFQWACGAGLVEGDATALYPQQEATRSELVTVLMRLSALQ